MLYLLAAMFTLYQVPAYADTIYLRCWITTVGDNLFQDGKQIVDENRPWAFLINSETNEVRKKLQNGQTEVNKDLTVSVSQTIILITRDSPGKYRFQERLRINRLDGTVDGNTTLTSSTWTRQNKQNGHCEKDSPWPQF